MGFTGEDCSQCKSFYCISPTMTMFIGDPCCIDLCPKAFDPSTLSERQSRRTIRMLIGNNGTISSFSTPIGMGEFV